MRVNFLEISTFFTFFLSGIHHDFHLFVFSFYNLFTLSYLPLPRGCFFLSLIFCFRFTCHLYYLLSLILYFHFFLLLVIHIFISVYSFLILYFPQSFFFFTKHYINPVNGVSRGIRSFTHSSSSSFTAYTTFLSSIFPFRPFCHSPLPVLGQGTASKRRECGAKEDPMLFPDRFMRLKRERRSRQAKSFSIG